MVIINNKKQPPEVFYTKAVPKIFSIFTGKDPCSSLSLIKLPAFRPPTLSKRDSKTSAFCKYCEIFKNAYFEENLWTAPSE